MRVIKPMPRQARIDAPGAVHHIIARGIERGKIFRGDNDRDAGDWGLVLAVNRSLSAAV